MCGLRAEIVASIGGEKYGEGQIVTGLSSGGELVEIWAAAGGRTWSLLVSRADGLACLLAVGADLRIELPPPASAEAKPLRLRAGRPERGRGL